MGDILSALSIIFGVLSALFLQWSTNIENAGKLEIGQDYQENREALEYLLKFKLQPLTAAITILTLIMIPTCTKILITTFTTIYKYKFISYKYYDIVSLIILFIFILSLWLCVYLIKCTIKLRKKLQ